MHWKAPLAGPFSSARVLLRKMTNTLFNENANVSPPQFFMDVQGRPEHVFEIAQRRGRVRQPSTQLNCV
jgi:hypothetical protein